MSRPVSCCSPWVGHGSSPGWDALRRWWYHRSPPRDPLKRVEAVVDWRELVPRAEGDFRRYLAGRSQVQVGTFEEVCGWLLACRYVPDGRATEQEDHWQHPLEFERSRLGDCEDHALWGWRKLCELGWPVEFVVGLWNPTSGDRLVNHAWLHVHHEGRFLLLETTAAGRAAMATDVGAQLPRYLPTASIDHRLRTYYFANYFHARLYGRPLAISGEGTQGALC